MLSDQAYEAQRSLESEERTVVGVNRFTEGNEEGEMTNLFRVDPGVEQEQKQRLAQVRRRRDPGRVEDALSEIQGIAQGQDNLMPAILKATKACATEGEIFRVLRSVWGEYRPAAIF